MNQKKRQEIAKRRAELLGILAKVAEVDAVHGRDEPDKLRHRYQEVRGRLEKLERGAGPAS